jgi:hypothetical protein
MSYSFESVEQRAFGELKIEGDQSLQRLDYEL